MSIYMVTYDLKNKDHDYSDLYKTLNDFNSVHPFESVWFIDSLMQLSDIFDKLKNSIHNGADTIFLSRIRVLSDCNAHMGTPYVDWFKSANRSWDGLK